MNQTRPLSNHDTEWESTRCPNPLPWATARWAAWFLCFAVARLASVAGDEPGALDPSFALGGGLDGQVNALALQPDGKLVIVGSFNAVDTVPRAGVARLHAGESLDTTFDPGTGPGSDYNPVACAVAVQADGKVLVGGQFTSIAGVARSGLARLNRDGSLDTQFTPHPMGTWEAAYVYALALQPDGRIVVANYSWVYRLNPDGSLDSTFQASSMDRNPLSIALQPDGRILVGGQFEKVNSVARNNLVRLQANGQLDATFDPGSGPGGRYSWTSAWITALALQPDGKVLAGGVFSRFAGVERNNLARLNPDGTLDTSFAPALVRIEVDYYSRSVHGIAIQPDGKVLVCGSVEATNAHGMVFGQLFRLNVPGDLDDSFHPQVEGGQALCVAPAEQGGVLLGGSFELVNGQPRRGLARLLGGIAPTILVEPQSQRVLPGTTAQFGVSADGSPTLSYVWRKNGLALAPAQHGPSLSVSNAQSSDAGEYTVVVSNAFGSVLSDPAALVLDAVVQGPALVSQPQGQTVVEGGHGIFRVVALGTAPLSYQWRKNGVDLAGATDPTLSLVAVRPEDAASYSVRVSNLGGTVTSAVAQLTVLTPPIFTPPASPITALAGQTVTLEVTVRGTAPLYFQWRFNGTAIPGATQPALILGGVQRTASGSYTLLVSNAVGLAISPAVLLAVWQPGAVDPTFQANLHGFYNYGIHAVLPQPDGQILVAARPLQQLWGGPRWPSFSLLRLLADGSRDPTFQPNLGPRGGLRAVALLPDGKILIGGEFFGVNGVKRNGLARLHPDGTLDTTFDPVPTHCFRVQVDGDADTGNQISFDSAFEVWALAVQPDGKVLAGGKSRTPFDWLRRGLVRFNPDGSIDPTFDPALVESTEDTTWVKALALQSDGKILVACSFLGSPVLQTPGQATVVRLNSDGSLDPGFAPSTIVGEDDGQPEPVGAVVLVLQPDGKILAGGSFINFNGEPRPGLARMNRDGELDLAFVVPGGLRDVRALALQPDAKLLVGGAFSPVSPSQASGIVRLNADGALDLGFDPGQGASDGQSCWAVGSSALMVLSVVVWFAYSEAWLPRLSSAPRTRKCAWTRRPGSEWKPPAVPLCPINGKRTVWRCPAKPIPASAWPAPSCRTRASTQCELVTVSGR
jgi:uncharacterized delta-60 repeat protein